MPFLIAVHNKITTTQVVICATNFFQWTDLLMLIYVFLKNFSSTPIGTAYWKSGATAFMYAFYDLMYILIMTILAFNYAQ